MKEATAIIRLKGWIFVQTTVIITAKNGKIPAIVQMIVNKSFSHLVLPTLKISLKLISLATLHSPKSKILFGALNRH
jgi:hypothetical protein